VGAALADPSRPEIGAQLDHHFFVVADVALNRQDFELGIRLFPGGFATDTVGGDPPAITESRRTGGARLYSGSAASDGSFSLEVSTGTYNVYGWYTTWDGSTPTTVKKSSTSVTVGSGETKTVGLAWP
jgi:hypothetical protein